MDVLQSMASAITKCDNIFVLQSGEYGITIQGKNCKVGQPLLESWQLLQSRAVHMPLQLSHGKFPLTLIFTIWSIDGFDWEATMKMQLSFLDN